MMMMMFLMLLVFGLAHFSMLVATKQMLDYAAFAAARTVLVGGDAQAAAAQVMDASLRWSNQTPQVTGDPGCSAVAWQLRGGVQVETRVPFGLPIFNDIPAGGLQVISQSACEPQDTFNESGDNASSAGF